MHVYLSYNVVCMAKDPRAWFEVGGVYKGVEEGTQFGMYGVTRVYK